MATCVVKLVIDVDKVNLFLPSLKTNALQVFIIEKILFLHNPSYYQ